MNSRLIVFFLLVTTTVCRDKPWQEAQFQCGVSTVEGGLDLQTHWKEDLGCT